jgi:hypothetical protein
MRLYLDFKEQITRRAVVPLPPQDEQSSSTGISTSRWPRTLATMDVTSSGNDVPMATIVKPITNSRTPNSRAMSTEPLTSQREPTPNRMSPTRMRPMWLSIRKAVGFAGEGAWRRTSWRSAKECR